MLKKNHKLTGSTDKTFGLFFALIFLLFSIWPFFQGNNPRIWLAFFAVSLAIIAFIAPRLLSPFNKIWSQFGLFLHRLISPLVLGLIYLIAVIPISLALKLSGKDPLRLKIEPENDSYWILVKESEKTKSSMLNQY